MGARDNLTRQNPRDLRPLYRQSPYRTPFLATRGYPEIDLDALGVQLREMPAVGNPGLAPAPELAELPLPAPFRQPPAIPFRDELRYGSAKSLPLTIGIAATRVLLAPPPNTRRTLLLIVNTHATQILFVGFGDVATTLLTPINPANGALGFDHVVPQDDIYLIANGAATTCVLTYMNKGVNDYPSLPE